MRIEKEHKEYAAKALTEGTNKREIIEALSYAPTKGIGIGSLTLAQANNCVRNQAKKLGLYNKLTKAQKTLIKAKELENDKSHKARLNAIMDHFEGGFEKKKRPIKRKRERE